MKQQKQVVSSKREAKQTNAQLISKAIVKTAEETSAMYQVAIESEKARELKIQYNKILHDIPKILNEEEM